MRYEFIEIGTADFDTELQDHRGRQGISVDIIQEYLDHLPTVPNVKKRCYGISNVSGEVDAFRPIFPDSFPGWLRGCVSILKPHPHVIQYCHAHHVDYQSYIHVQKVPILSVEQFIHREEITGVEYLKIDTEGHDCVILNAWLDAAQAVPSLLPSHILYESKDLTDMEERNQMQHRLRGLGYRLVIHEYDVEAWMESK